MATAPAIVHQGDPEPVGRVQVVELDIVVVAGDKLPLDLGGPGPVGPDGRLHDVRAAAGGFADDPLGYQGPELLVVLPRVLQLLGGGGGDLQDLAVVYLGLGQHHGVQVVQGVLLQVQGTGFLGVPVATVGGGPLVAVSTAVVLVGLLVVLEVLVVDVAHEGEGA